MKENLLRVLPAGLKKTHLTFRTSEGVVSTFASDNAAQLRGWWAVQCAKLNNPARKGFVITLIRRDFTDEIDITNPKLPIKNVSYCVFEPDPFPFNAEEVREHLSRFPEFQGTDISFVEFEWKDTLNSLKNSSTVLHL